MISEYQLIRTHLASQLLNASTSDKSFQSRAGEARWPIHGVGICNVGGFASCSICFVRQTATLSLYIHKDFNVNKNKKRINGELVFGVH